MVVEDGNLTYNNYKNSLFENNFFCHMAFLCVGRVNSALSMEAVVVSEAEWTMLQSSANSLALLSPGQQ